MVMMITIIIIIIVTTMVIMMMMMITVMMIIIIMIMTIMIRIYTLNAITVCHIVVLPCSLRLTKMSSKMLIKNNMDNKQ